MRRLGRPVVILSPERKLAMSRTETGSRERIVDATLVLLRRGGLAASGVNSVVAEGKAPKGSVYHYFPVARLIS